MQLLLSQSPTPLSLSLPGRLAVAMTEAARAAVATFQSTWRSHPACPTQTDTLEMMSDLNSHTLRDIGAPDWLIAQSVERRDAHGLRLIELYRS